MLTTKQRLVEIRDLKQEKYEVMCDLHYLRPKIAELDEEVKSLTNKITHNKMLLDDLINFPNFKKKTKIFTIIFTIALFLLGMTDYGFNSVEFIKMVKYLLLYSSAGLSTYFLMVYQEKSKFKNYTEQQLTDLIEEQTDRHDMKENDLNLKRNQKSILLCQKHNLSYQIKELNSYVPNISIISATKEPSLHDNREEVLGKMYCLKRPKHKNNSQK